MLSGVAPVLHFGPDYPQVVRRFGGHEQEGTGKQAKAPAATPPRSPSRSLNTKSLAVAFAIQAMKKTNPARTPKTTARPA
jgi:hypothetical protein